MSKNAKLTSAKNLKLKMVHEKNENKLKVQHSGPIIQGKKNA